MDTEEIEWFIIYQDSDDNDVSYETPESWQEIRIRKIDYHPEDHYDCLGCATWEMNFWDEYEDEIQFSIIVLASALLLSLLIALWLYISYIYKNKEHPFKYAIKKTWPWLIVIFVVSAIIIYLWNFVDWVYYLFN